jgi:UDP-glucose 4-epimerase
MARVLVTGGAGFIGSNLVDALLARGDDVAVIDDLSTGRASNLEAALAAGATLHRADIRDADEVERVFAAERPEQVFHAAAQIDVRHSVADPAADASINVGGTINMLVAAQTAGVARFVYSSTGGALYGDTEVIPSPEDSPIRPLAPYGMSKFAGEGYVDLFARLHGLSTVTLRYANVYGPRQDPLGEGGVVAIFAGRLKDGARPTVFGDGTQTRDFVHVADVVEANLAAAATDAGGAFNVGTGVETSVLDLVELLAPLARDGSSFQPEFAPERPGELERSCLDVSRGREVLGWEPRIAVQTGVRETVEEVLASA